MKSFFEKMLVMPLAAKLLLAVNAGSLLFAFTMQYGFDFQPCVLCLWQRVPYAVCVLLAGILWSWRPYGRQTSVLLGLCAAFYLAGMGTAVFHTGVEQHWWLGTSGCSIQPLAGTSAEDLRESLLHTVSPRCDQISWTLFGLSMTNWNIAMSLGLALFAAAAAATQAQKAKSQST